MRTRRTGFLRLALVGVAAATVLAGCGGGGNVDSGGFTPGQFGAAQNALAVLGPTSVYDLALKTSLTFASPPTACVVHIETTTPLTFRVFMTWIPNQSILGRGTGRPFAWLSAVIGTNGLQGDYSFHSGNEVTEAALRAQYGDVFNTPVEKCLVLENRRFGLLPAA